MIRRWRWCERGKLKSCSDKIGVAIGSMSSSSLLAWLVIGINGVGRCMSRYGHLFPSMYCILFCLSFFMFFHKRIYYFVTAVGCFLLHL
ncbi:uncharacterized protein RJT20DRAFT_129287 [Scheffersomyces xylosifermentans]|uniref:uncharacterized protein n=1 Tax=Scheffersomyces xylosifermentans TaxID=1304137 RepID=UPI00315C5FA6